LSEAEIAFIDRAKISRHYAPGEIIYSQGDECAGIFCIESGLVGIRRLDENGNSTLLRLSSPGETVGYESFLTRTLYSNGAEALMASDICFVDRAVVRRLLQDNPKIGLSFLDHSLHDLAAIEDRYMESVTSRAKRRLLQLLLDLNDRFGIETDEGGCLIELPISRQDLAGLIGSAPETMSRTIHRLQTEGLAQFDGRTVRIFDIDAIQSEASIALRAIGRSRRY
jgi:CRP/FNR family transcriptional regulator